MSPQKSQPNLNRYCITERFFIFEVPEVAARLNIAPSFLVKLPDCVFDILYECQSNSPSAAFGKRSGKTDPTPLKCRLTHASPYHAIHLSVTSQFSSDVTLTSSLLHESRATQSAKRKCEYSSDMSTVTMKTTSSSQNQPPAVTPAVAPAATPAATRCTRKRGIYAVLQDITNTCDQPLSRRSSVRRL